VIKVSFHGNFVCSFLILFSGDQTPGCAAGAGGFGHEKQKYVRANRPLCSADRPSQYPLTAFRLFLSLVFFLGHQGPGCAAGAGGAGQHKIFISFSISISISIALM